METRVDAVKGFSETFDYDNLNRLTHTYADFGNGDVQETAVAYDALGNIISKTGVGVYQYGNQCAGNTAGPHAVCAISAQDQSSNTIGTKNAVYSYDLNGNMLSGDGRSITWSLFDKPTQISQNGNTTLMGYGPERQLITRQDTTTAGTTNTVFVGGLYEKVTDQNGNIKERHYVGSHTIVTYSNRSASSAGTIETRYLHKDHIGSVVLITDENGNEVESFSFDPWGKRRAPSLADLETALGNWNSLDAFQKGNLTISALALGSDITNKGFTGHEQMDQVNLIHMGGRVYDAEIGRFLSADPFVQDSTNIQALNRYSYVQNNPLSYTDPSGYNIFSEIGDAIGGVFKAAGDFVQFVGRGIRSGLRKIGRLFAEVPGLSAAVTVFACTAGPWACPAVAKFMIGLNAAITAANGGTIEQVATGVAIGLVASGVPGADNSLINGGLTGLVGDTIKNDFIASLIIGGTIAKAQGQKFIDGVKGAAIGAAAGALGKSAGLWAKDNVFNGPTVSIETAVQTPAIKNTMAVAEPAFAEDSVAFASPSAAPYSSQGVIEEVLVTGKMDGCMIVSCTVPAAYVNPTITIEQFIQQQLNAIRSQQAKVVKNTFNYIIKPAAYIAGGPVSRLATAYDFGSILSSVSTGSPAEQLGAALSSPTLILQGTPAAAASIYTQGVMDIWSE